MRADTVGNAIHLSSFVVGNQKASVGHDKHVHGTSRNLGARQPTVRERFVVDSPILSNLYKHDPIDERIFSIPGAVLCNEYSSAVFFRTLGAGVEAHSQGSNVRPQCQDWRRKGRT